MEEFTRIVRDPEICGGQPTIQGTRVLILDILELLKEGQTFAEILTGFPSITRKNIQEILSYAEMLIVGEIVLYGTAKSSVSAR